MDQDIRNAVLAYTGSAAYKPVKPKVIGERLGLAGDALELARKTIKKMIKAGDLEYGPNHMVLPMQPGHAAREGIAAALKPGVPKVDGAPSATDKQPGTRAASGAKSVVGTFRRIGSGDGFVRPEGTPAATGRDSDVYVNKKNAGDAASGDIVRIRMDKRTGYKGKPEGKVIDVVERQTNTFVGTYLEEGGQGLVMVDGGVFTAPIYVGDPGAKGANPEDKVAIEMVRFPSHMREGEGVITQRLGASGAPGVDTMAIKIEFALPGEFPPEVLEDARGQAERFDESIPKTRTDLTGEVVATIDPVDARDFDDAISLRRIEGGHWELGVHIADVSHFVQPKTALDSEAYDRATSVYLPDEVIPMLPEIISNNLASLQPDKVRYAMTCRIEFTPEGVPVGADVFKSAIKSRRRFTYEEIDAYLAETGLVKASKSSPPRQGEGAAPGKTPTKANAKRATNPLPNPPPAGEGVKATLTPEVDALVADMFELAMMLRRRRLERGALELNMPEIKVDLDKDGRVSGAHLETQTESHQIIEEFMLAANEAVARNLRDAGLLFLRRVHGAPDPKKMAALTAFVRDLGFQVESLENRFELQKLLGEAHGDPREPALNFAALRSMQRAIYSPEEEGHYALASDCYCHFTSPIRRYPDLTVHRLLEALAIGKKPVQDEAALFAEGDHCSDREHRAASAERELTKVKLLNYLKDKIGLEMNGVITGVESFGMFIQGDKLPAEGMVHISALTDDYYKFDRASHSITGFRGGNSFRLGDPVRVAVASVDVDGRKLDFRLLGRGEGKRAPKPKKTSGRPPKGRSDKTGKHRRKKG
ncbi:Ribonuclease R [Pirellulimonas nuda]|uniref:Ribonuclease R n=1 Tax=Pirellulimonas nuda TaxID=2528009 RepID=A0A518D7N0_9BACT|nr:RNB domain-containing ribonuclease [Pirellulimonas nuda]QDU87492.1 Ribonuclease R [Pirellulimonas nuda]